MKYLIITLLGFVHGLAFCQSNLEGSEDKKNSASESVVTPSELALNQQLESLVLDYELERTSNFNNGLKVITTESLNEMESITNEVITLNPNSYASEYLQFKQDGFTEAGLNHLKNAETKTTNSTELISDFLAISHILKKNDLLDTYALKLRNSGFLKNSVLEYNKNVLRSFTESNALLITNGWEDTYPLLALLKEEKKRTITVVNVEWLYDAGYRSTLSAILGKPIVPFSSPYQWINQMTSGSSLPIYYAPSLPNSELIKLQNELTPVGIVFKKGMLSGLEQKTLNLNAWKKFSKLSINSSEPLNKNYIIMLTMLEQQLKTNALEKGTLKQVTDAKKALIKKHPSLK
ncbi:MAG: hypothetical protein AB8B53_06180 [Flavobacteriales bacterium]